MTTFQAVIYALVTSITTLFPIGDSAHLQILTLVTGWESPSDEFRFTIIIGMILGLFIYYIHDWMSILISSLRDVLTLQKPASIDGRFVWLSLITVAPLTLLNWFHTQGILDFSFLNFLLEPWVVALELVLLSIPQLLEVKKIQKLKTMLNWTAIDALWVGFGQCLALLPGGGQVLGSIQTARFRKYDLASATKYCFLTLTLFLVFKATSLANTSDHALFSGPKISLLSLGVAFTVAMGSTLFCVYSFNKSALTTGLRAYWIYRILVGLGLLGYALTMN